MKGLRRTPREIRKGIVEGFDERREEGWYDLINDFNLTTSREENLALAEQCAVFLERAFPTEDFGWQDFDRMLAERLQGRWADVESIAIEVIGTPEGNPQGVTALREPVSPKVAESRLLSRLNGTPGVHVMEATDKPGTFILFTGLHALGDVLRV